MAAGALNEQVKFYTFLPQRAGVLLGSWLVDVD
jgi:hypothetical protein